MSTRMRRNISLALTGIGLYALYIIIMVVLGQPLYVLLLTYVLTILLYCFFNRRNIWAVRGNYYYMLGNRQKAKALLQKAANAGTKSPSAYIYLALMAIQDDMDPKTAFGLLESAQKFSVSVVDERNAKTTLAACYWLDGNPQKAIDVLEDMRKTHEYTNAGVLTTLAFMHFKLGDYDKAMEISKLAIQDDENQGAAWDNIGQIYYAKGDIAAACENFEIALSKKENLVDSNYYLGLIYEARNDYEKAKEHFRKAQICTISMYNTVTNEQIEEKYKKYFGCEGDQ